MSSRPKQFKPHKLTTKKYKRPGLETGSAKGYDKEWEKYRWRFLHYNKKCYACGATKEDVGQLHIDHVIPHKGDMDLFWKVTNLIPLCKYCHNTVTGLFDKYEVPRTQEKMEWIQRKRLQFNVDVKVVVVPRKSGGYVNSEMLQ